MAIIYKHTNKTTEKSYNGLNLPERTIYRLLTSGKGYSKKHNLYVGYSS